MKKTMLLVDANAIVHYSYHAYAPQLDAKGKDQRVLRGLMDALAGFTQKVESIDSLVVVFDPDDGAKSRTDLFPEYKANRPPVEEDLKRQRNDAKFILSQKLGVPNIAVAGHEADDAIGSLAKTFSNKFSVIIASPDKDLMQLVNDDVHQMRRVRSKDYKGYIMLTPEKVFEEVGVRPNQIPDWLALVGDSADNLPGLEKVGPVTAKKLLGEYGNIETLIAQAPSMSNSSLRDKLLNSQESLKLVKQLATVKTDLAVRGIFEDEMRKAHAIRAASDYQNNLQKLEHFFSWPPYLKKIF